MRAAIIVVVSLLCLLALGSVAYKLYAPTNKTVVQAGGKVVTVNTEGPKVRLFSFGCSNLAVEATWKRDVNIWGTQQNAVKHSFGR